jgi:hypothetical protein
MVWAKLLPGDTVSLFNATQGNPSPLVVTVPCVRSNKAPSLGSIADPIVTCPDIRTVFKEKSNVKAMNNNIGLLIIIYIILLLVKIILFLKMKDERYIIIFNKNIFFTKK